MKVQGNERDLRFDFFRGLALLLICINHIESLTDINMLSFVTLNTTGLYDNAMTFVFISGFMYGYVYEKIFLNHGLLMTWMRSLVRAAQIYFFHVILLPFGLGMAALYLLYSHDWFAIERLHLSPYLNGDFLFFAKFLLFSHLPPLLEILPLYVLLLVAMPLCLYGCNRNQVLTICLVFLIYVISGFIALLHLKKCLPLGDSSFPLTQWQILFSIGVILGVRRRLGTLHVSYSKKYLYPAIIWLIIVFINEKLLFLINDYIIEIGPTLLHHIPLTSRYNMGPLRVLTFFVLVYVVAYFVPKDSKIFQIAAGKALIACGQNSLEVYSFGIALTYAAIFLMKFFKGGYVLLLLVHISAVMLSVAFAYYMKWRKKEPWRLAPSTA